MLPITGQEYGCVGGYIAFEKISNTRPYGLVVDALPPLVLHDVALRVQLREVERVEQKPHPVGLDPQHGLEIVRRDGLVVVRDVVRRRAVVHAARALGELVVQAVGDVARPGEHHVLEQVREAGAPGHLVLRSDVIPDVHGDGRRRAIDRQHDVQPVRQRVGLEWNVDLALRRDRRRSDASDQGACSECLHAGIMD